MLHQIASEYKGLPVHLVLDNARYQKCTAVQGLAGKLGISLEYIPPYSPNLNLIERIWKFVKGELRSKPKYTGNVLAVGISYDKKSKEHKCRVEVLGGEG